jgi:imidazoleglycerol-phosphate dehydratase
MEITCQGDLHIDFHHTVEDVGIALGQAIKEAIGDKKGIRRYASCDLPMDGTLTRAALDVSGRPFLVFKAEFSRDKIGDIDTELFQEFFQAFAINAGITLHIENCYFDNNHHLAESMFKAVARSLRDALEIDPRQADRVPSTKGTL